MRQLENLQMSWYNSSPSLFYFCRSLSYRVAVPTGLLSSHKSVMESRSRPLRIYSIEDLAFQKKLGKVWIARKGRVYDVTEFVNDHPGGDDLITQFSGQDIGSAMEDEEEHLHSSSAYSMLEEYVIGRLGNDALVVSEGQYARPRRTEAQMLTRIHQTGLQTKIFIQMIRILMKTTSSVNSWTCESRSSVKFGRPISGISLPLAVCIYSDFVQQKLLPPAGPSASPCRRLGQAFRPGIPRGLHEDGLVRCTDILAPHSHVSFPSLCAAVHEAAPTGLFRQLCVHSSYTVRPL